MSLSNTGDSTSLDTMYFLDDTRVISSHYDNVIRVFNYFQGKQSIGKPWPNSRIKPRMYVRCTAVVLCMKKLRFIRWDWHKDIKFCSMGVQSF